MCVSVSWFNLTGSCRWLLAVTGIPNLIGQSSSWADADLQRATADRTDEDQVSLQKDTAAKHVTVDVH